jgi:hypothetical protein
MDQERADYAEYEPPAPEPRPVSVLVLIGILLAPSLAILSCILLWYLVK